MAEDDDKPADQPVAACRIVQGALGWLKRAPEGEEGYLVGHLACPGRRFPDVLGALAKRSNAHTWGGDKQDLEHHLPAGLEIVGIYGASFEEAAAVFKELGLPLPGLLAGCAGGVVTLQDTQGNPVAVEAVDGQDLLAKDYVVLRLSWTRSLLNHDDADDHELVGDNAHLFFPAAGDASGEAGPMVLPVPLHTSSSSSSSSSQEASFLDSFTQAALMGAVTAAAATTTDVTCTTSSNSKKNKRHKKKGGGKGSSQAGRAVDETSAQTTTATLDDLVRETAIGPILDVALLRLQSPCSTAASHDGPVALISPNTHVTPAAPLSGAPVRRRAKGELLVYVAHGALFASAMSSLVKGLQRAWTRTRIMCAAATAADGSASSSVEVLAFHALDPTASNAGGASPLAFPLSLMVSLFLVAPGDTSRPSGGWVHAPGQEDDRAELLAVRCALHERLRLPLNRPFFRSTCALRLASPAASATADEDGDAEEASRGPQRLRDVHLGLPPSTLTGGTRHLVDGSYLFYHYLQDRMDDKGWGCAYRSLQTLVSFFRLSHYTTEPVPSHRDIQQVLVDIGDKPAGFVGSREWIGSMEVGFFLDQALGLQWRSVSAPSGPELAERAAELAAHFDAHGTPVMMGGGSLAFTLLGLDWNEATGEVAFLILDPHYTGPEDLQVVQTKEVALEGYRATACGWRSPASFARNSFFNLCLPQRPDMY